MLFSSLLNPFLHHGILRFIGVFTALILLDSHIDPIKKVPSDTNLIITFSNPF